MKCKVVVYIAVLFSTSFLKSGLLAQTGQSHPSFVRDANRPFVYLMFDHVGIGVRRNQDEPSARIWFRFVNNCNVPIVLHADGGLKGMLAGEVSVWDRVIPDPPILEITPGSPEPEVEHTPLSRENQLETTDRIQQFPKKMPNGYESEVGSSIRIAPGHSVLFSVPIDHLGTKNGAWHMEVPFWFGVPEGRGRRDPAVGGEPSMSLSYSLYDLPTEARAIVSKSE